MQPVSTRETRGSTTDKHYVEISAVVPTYRCRIDIDLEITCTCGWTYTVNGDTAEEWEGIIEYNELVRIVAAHYA